MSEAVNKSAFGRVPVECPHGHDVCPICDRQQVDIDVREKLRQDMLRIYEEYGITARKPGSIPAFTKLLESAASHSDYEKLAAENRVMREAIEMRMLWDGYMASDTGIPSAELVRRAEEAGWSIEKESLEEFGERHFAAALSPPAGEVRP